jgi:hypothetical protein
MGWKKKNLCCRQSQTACNTVCCPQGTYEIEETGVCCASTSCKLGSYDPHTKKQTCMCPTAGLAKTATRRNSLKLRQQLALDLAAPATNIGMLGNAEHKLCPVGLAACPIPNTLDGAYECLDAKSDLQSCGGCQSLGQGQDCTAIPGARWMGCVSGKCEVYSCKAGYKRSDGGCVRI